LSDINVSAPDTKDLALLRRYLRATRREFSEAPGLETVFAQQIALNAFPGIDLHYTLFPMRSRSLKCEIVPAGGTSFVVLDFNLSDRLMELDLLTQVAVMKPDWAYAFFVVLLGDAFRQNEDLVRYRYCVLKARGDIGSLRSLASLPKEGAPIHAALVPVLLHEWAHIVFRRPDDFVPNLRELCRATLAKFADASAEQAETGQPPVAEAVTLGIPFEQYDQKRLKQQLSLYATTIQDNTELEEELCCDLIAALAFLNMHAGINCFHDLVPPSIRLSRRQLGDALYLAIKTSRYLQILTGIGQFGSNVARGSDTLHRGIIEMTARTNALTHILLRIFQVQMQGTRFADKPDFGKPLTSEEMNTVMHRSLAHLMRLHHDRLLGPFEQLTEFFVTPASFEADNEKLLDEYAGAPPASFGEVDELRKQFPI
jgi:hypothetical protein